MRLFHCFFFPVLLLQGPPYRWTPSRPPTPPLRSSWSGSLQTARMATSPTTGSSVVSSQRTVTSTSLTTAYKVSIWEVPWNQLGYSFLLLLSGFPPHVCVSCSGMKPPSRIPTYLDIEEEQKWNHTDDSTSEGKCCTCPLTKSQIEKEQQEIEYRKTFENYLHNEVFESR